MELTPVEGQLEVSNKLIGKDLIKYQPVLDQAILNTIYL